MKFFYVANNEKIGPFSIEELKKEPLKRDSLVWYFGMESWQRLEDVELLEEVFSALPPSLIQKKEIQEEPQFSNNELLSQKVAPIEHQKLNVKKGAIWSKVYLLGFIISVAINIYIIFIGDDQIEPVHDEVDYDQFSTNAYELNFDYNFYLNKYYRDLNAFGISPIKPRSISIKFVDMQYFEGMTHYNGVSFGFGDDSRVEIFLNRDSWDSFNRGEKFWVMYHELSHDILNYDHTPSDKLGEGSLMDPYFSTLDNISMDDFIEAWYVFMEHYME